MLNYLRLVTWPQPTCMVNVRDELHIGCVPYRKYVQLGLDVMYYTWLQSIDAMAPILFTYTAKRADSSTFHTPHCNLILDCIPYPNPLTPPLNHLILIIPAVRSRPHSSTTARRAAFPPLLTGQRLMWSVYTALLGVTKCLSPLVATTARRCRPVKNYHNSA